MQRWRLRDCAESHVRARTRAGKRERTLPACRVRHPAGRRAKAAGFPIIKPAHQKARRCLAALRIFPAGCRKGHAGSVCSHFPSCSIRLPSIGCRRIATNGLFTQALRLRRKNLPFGHLAPEAWYISRAFGSSFFSRAMRVSCAGCVLRNWGGAPFPACALMRCQNATASFGS